MNNAYPIYTLKNECHDCYKCIRHCPVKAIKIQDGHASVISEKCIACGRCVTVCPQNAKKVRNDLDKTKNLLSSNKKILVSLAPTWQAVFDVPKENIIASLKKLGFDGVSETALGAQEVSVETAKRLSKGEMKLNISSACPAIVDYVKTYAPEFSQNITPVASPALTHAKMLKEKYEKDLAVVFIGPCIAKKNESDSHPEIIEAVLTFDELKQWFSQEQIDINNTADIESFIPHQAYEGSLYPIEGGMNETLKKCNIDPKVQLINVSSIQSFKEALSNLDLDQIDAPIFIEALACSGGCLSGPCNSDNKSNLMKISKVLSSVETRESIPQYPELVFSEDYKVLKPDLEEPSLDEILSAMRSIGKQSIEDELNCGGCGYDTCRQLARALILGEAEPSMCTSYMRKIAAKKAGAMLKFMPSGIVMVDPEHKIIETNKAFLKMFAKDLYEVFKEGIEETAGASLDKILPECSDMFKLALRSGREIHKERYPINDGLYDIILFTVEENRILGAVFTDVTKTEMRRDQIAKKAQAVINKNLTIVQEIACMLGEHMVDTELLLSSITEGYESESEVEKE